jgi:ATP-dependent protease HslVU (ClpYQ) peptidase subunit
MSVIVAIKEKDVIYLGADSQTSSGRKKHTYLNETAYKVVKLKNDVLVGFCGRVAARQTILAMKDVFTLDENGGLTKKHIVQQIVPKLLDKMEQIGDEESGALDVSILLAHKDKMYKITADLDVIHLNENASLGAGKYYVNYALFGMPDIPVKERILKALIESAKHTESVAGPYVLIDTKNLEYEVVDKGGENH